MMKKMKKTAVKGTLFPALVIAALLVFSGCSPKESGGSAAKGARTGEKGAIPISTTKPELSMFIAGGLSERVTSYDYNDNEFTRQVTDETGIQLKITATTGADSTERLNIMLSAGDYPDIIANADLDIEYYANQGIIVSLDRDELMGYPSIRKIFDEYPIVTEKISAADGKIYGLPAINECLHCTYQFGRTWYYMPWIRDTGRKTPETLDEFAEYLRFVKNTDLNKNGKKDEVPLVFNSGDALSFIARIAKAYMPFVYGSYYGLALDSGRKIVEQYRDPAFRETLKYINGLYREGLILEDSFSMSWDQESSLIRNSDPVVAVYSTPWMYAPDERGINYFYLPALRGPSGERWGTNTDPWDQVAVHWFVTNKCKDVDLAIALYDYINNWDRVGQRISGPKGVTWDDADADGKGFDGRPAKWKMLTAFSDAPVNSAWWNIYINVQSQADRVATQTDQIDEMIDFINTGKPDLIPGLMENGTWQEYMYYATSTAESKYALPANVFIPPLRLSNEDATRVADINAVLDPFKLQAFVEFIIGVRNINSDADWNAYLAELDRLGSPEMVSIRQKYIK